MTNESRNFANSDLIFTSDRTHELAPLMAPSWIQAHQGQLWLAGIALGLFLLMLLVEWLWDR